MYTTQWNVSKSELPEFGVNFVKQLEQELHNVDCQITVSDGHHGIDITIELFNTSEQGQLYQTVEKIAQNVIGVNEYTAWTETNAITINI